jgi:C1A family cysteine protease
MTTKRFLATISGLLIALFALTFIANDVAISQPVQIDVSKLKLPSQLLDRMKTKRQVSADVLRLYSVRNNKFLFRALPELEVELISPELMEYTPSSEQVRQSLQVHPEVLKYQSYYKLLRGIKIVPICFSTVDHRSKQTPIKNQGSRGTCVAHAAMAGLEVAYGSTTLDLNENYAYYKFLGSSTSQVCNDPGLRTIDAADLMTTYPMCLETYWPYVSSLSGLGCPTPSGWPTATCADNAVYQVTSHKKIWRNDTATVDAGEYINNPKYLESILCSGYDIVIGLYVAGWPSGGQGIIDVVNGASIAGGHAMVIVGYNRNGDANIGGGYFILKNSWGTGYGQSGYYYLSYDYIRTYSKYGFYITGVVKKPDLTVSILGPATAKPGQELGTSIKVKVTNRGTVEAKNVVLDLVLSSNTTVPVKFATYSASYSDDVLLKGGRENIASIPAGATVSVVLNGSNQIPTNTPKGKHYLGAVVDPGKAINELKEDNNTDTAPITIQ